MQLTRAADYGVRVLIHLAGRARGARVRRTELAREAGVPGTFLAKVLQRLTAAGLVASRRGRGGGFGLGRSGRRISLLDVVTAMEGPVCLNTCLSPWTPCPRSGWCAARLVWGRAQAQLARTLGGVSIEELARRSADRRRRRSR
jgi:Rrf2 family protein